MWGKDWLVLKIQLCIWCSWLSPVKWSLSIMKPSVYSHSCWSGRQCPPPYLRQPGSHSQCYVASPYVISFILIRGRFLAHSFSSQPPTGVCISLFMLLCTRLKTHSECCSDTRPHPHPVCGSSVYVCWSCCRGVESRSVLYDVLGQGDYHAEFYPSECIQLVTGFIEVTNSITDFPFW